MRPVLILFAIPVLLQIAWVIALNTAPATIREAARAFNGYWPQLICSSPGCIFLIRRLRGRSVLVLAVYIPLVMMTLFLVSILTGAALWGE